MKKCDELLNIQMLVKWWGKMKDAYWNMQRKTRETVFPLKARFRNLGHSGSLWSQESWPQPRATHTCAHLSCPPVLLACPAGHPLSLTFPSSDPDLYQRACVASQLNVIFLKPTQNLCGMQAGCRKDVYTPGSARPGWRPCCSPVAHLLHGVVGKLAADALAVRITWQFTKTKPSGHYLWSLLLCSSQTFSLRFSKSEA